MPKYLKGKLPSLQPNCLKISCLIFGLTAENLELLSQFAYKPKAFENLVNFYWISCIDFTSALQNIE